MTYTFISNETELATCCKSLEDSPFLALDTEFLRERTYFPQLALIQIADGHNTFVIDPLAIGDMSEFYRLIYKPDIVKVLHSARQDYEIFFHINDELPAPIFDTQVAASLLGYGEQLGYANLVKLLLDVELDKSQTRTDWTRRPLNHKQLDYAACDVIYLAQIYPRMQQQLDKLNRLEWLEADFNQLTDTATFEVDKRAMWKKIKSANRLSGPKLSIVQELADWRESKAIERDLPRKFVLSDENIADIANQKPATVDALRQIRQFNQRLKDDDLQQILNCIKVGENKPESEWPRFSKSNKPTTQQSAIIDILHAIVQLSADLNNISPAFICSRKDLVNVVCGSPDSLLFKGWRNKLVGEKIKGFLQGESHIALQNNVLTLI